MKIQDFPTESSPLIPIGAQTTPYKLETILESFSQFKWGKILPVVVDTSSILSEGQRRQLLKALIAINEGKTPGPKGVEAGLELFKALPPETKEAIEEQLPKEYHPLLSVVETTPPEYICKLIPEIMKVPDSNSISHGLNPDAVAKLHKNFTELPDLAKDHILQALPSGAKGMLTHVLDLTGGLKETEVKDLMTVINKEYGSFGSMDLEEGGESKAPDEAMGPHEAVRKTGMLAAKGETRRLLKMVKTTKSGLRAVAIICGVALAASCIINWIINISSGNGSPLLLNIWVIFCSKLILATEVKVAFFEQMCIRPLEMYAQFLGTVAGRGIFMVFAGLIGMSMALKGAWQDAFVFILGFATAIVGIAMTIMGRRASKRLNSLHEKMESEERVRQEFAAADKDNSGEIDVEELGLLCTKLGSTLSRSQLGAVLRTLDKDHNGLVSLEEFLNWWRRKTEATARATPPEVLDNLIVKAQGIKKPPIAIRILNVLAGIACLSSGNYELILQITKNEISFKQLLPVLLDAWLGFFGILILLFELGEYCAYLPSSPYFYILRVAAKVRQVLVEKHVRFLDTVFGRGLLYVFIGTMALSDRRQLPQIAGVFTFLVGVVNISAGLTAIRALSIFRKKIVEDGDLEQVFKHADSDRNGYVSMEELTAFCKTLGIRFDHREWELLVQNLDCEGSGEISVEEFERWWSMEAVKV